MEKDLLREKIFISGKRPFSCGNVLFLMENLFDHKKSWLVQKPLLVEKFLDYLV